MIGRTSIIAAALTMGAMFTSVASAQSHEPADSSAHIPAVPDTSVRRVPYQMAAMVISAERNRYVGVRGGIQARSDIWALERENRSLQRKIVRQGEEIDRLESRLNVLQEQESRMITQIAGIDSATAQTRAKRQRLEARLRSIREEGTIARQSGIER